MEPTRPGKSAATIFVKTLAGESLSVDVCLDETVLDLKRKIEAQEGTPVNQMRLIASNPGRQLNDDWTLRRSGLTDGCVIHLIQRLRGGGDIATAPLLPVLDFPTITAPGKEKSQLLHPASPDTEEPEKLPRVRRTVGPFRSCALLKEKCKRCVRETLPEVTPQIVLDPERNKTIYRAHLPHAGSFHCAETGLGFEVSAAVTVEYSYGSWAESLSPSAQENWMVAGPLFHIWAEPHRVRAVHLPHFVCLADEADESLCRIAHFEAGRMTPERPTSINHFFAVLNNPNFSQLGVLWRKLRSTFKFIPIHSLVLIYRTLSMADITLHLYLIPNDHSLQKAIEGKETTWKSTHVPKPPQTDPLYFGSRYQVSGLENLQITPAQLDFCYRSPGEQQSFVEIYTREMKKEIQLKVKGQEDGSLVWETLVRPGDVRLPASLSLGLPGVAFVEKHRCQLRNRMGQLESMLARFRDAQLLNSEEEEEVKSHQTSQRRNDALLQLVKRKGVWAQEELYKTLRETDPYLVQDLEASQ